MRLALASDIHGNLVTLGAVASDIRQRGADAVVNLGGVGLQAFDDDVSGYHVMEAGSPHARYAMIEITLAGWLV